MAQPRRGRPPNPVDPEASDGARLGAEVRARRLAAGLTLQALGDLAGGYTPQYVSEVERAKTAATSAFVTAVDRALDAAGAIETLLPAARREHERNRRERAAARRAAGQSALPCDAPVHSDLAGDADVEPTDRRGLLGAAGAAAIGLSTAAAPAAARAVDPELPAHYAALLSLLGRHDAAFGPHEVLAIVRRELGILADHRTIARGALRAALMRVEGRWSIYAAWLCEDTGDAHGRDRLADRALRLGREGGDPDVIGWTRARQSQWSSPRRAVLLAASGLRTPRVGAQTRALCAVRAAHGHARMGDPKMTSRMLTEAQTLLEQDSPPPPNTALPSTDRLVRCWEARCWAVLEPAKGAELYDAALRDWPRGWTRDGGLYRARLALACAAAGEQDRAAAEGRRAWAISRATKSVTAQRELRRLGAALNGT
jgi:transcriptional regulator with XRE-family HTH domain